VFPKFNYSFSILELADKCFPTHLIPSSPSEELKHKLKLKSIKLGSMPIFYNINSQFA